MVEENTFVVKIRVSLCPSSFPVLVYLIKRGTRGKSMACLPLCINATLFCSEKRFYLMTSFPCEIGYNYKRRKAHMYLLHRYDLKINTYKATRNHMQLSQSFENLSSAIFYANQQMVPSEAIKA